MTPIPPTPDLHDDLPASLHARTPARLPLRLARRPLRRTATWGLAAVVATAGLMAVAQDKKAAATAASAPRPALTVAMATPQRANLPLTLAANGSLAAWQEASVGAEAGGLRLTEVRVNVGDSVRKGQVLAVFATETLNAEAAQGRAALAEAEAAAAEAAANAERARALQPTGALSAAQINQFLTADKTAQARVQAARATLEAQNVRLAQSQVLAPDDGLISARTATVGAVVPNGAELFRLIRQGRLEWRAEVTSAELARLQVGTPATVTAASGTRLQGRVRMLAPTVDPQTRNGLVYVDVTPVATPGLPTRAMAGMFARGEFQLGGTSALTLPQSAVVVRDGFSYVMQLGEGDRVSARKVQTGRMVGERIEITGGLEPNARVVASGGSFLSDGDVVRIAAAASPASAPPAAGSAPARAASK
jgi:RND family efflux transporter MFP subunit